MQQIKIHSLFLAFFILASCGGSGGGGSATYTVGGMLSGLSSGSVTLQNNAGDDLTLSSSGSFVFNTALADGASFNVTVSAQPATLSCTASANTGTLAGSDVTSVQVNCAANTYTVGGNLSGLAASESVTLQNNGSDDLVLAANGAFVFSTAIADGAGYSVQVSSQPSGQVCSAAMNVGNVSGSNIADVDITCAAASGAGTLDPAFNAAGSIPGIVTFDRDPAPSAFNEDAGNAITTDSMDRVLVAGSSQKIGTDDSMALWRYQSTGALDATFNAGGLIPGLVLHDISSSANADVGNAIAIDNNGKIVVAGSSRDGIGIDTDMALWRFNTDGSLDTTFNAVGFITHDGAVPSSFDDVGLDVTVDASNNILVTGTSTDSNGDLHMVIWRYTPAGVLDATFNSAGSIPGVVTRANAINDNHGNSITTDSSGRIVVTGRSSVADGSVAIIWRYTSAGVLDTNFNAGGTTPGIAVFDASVLSSEDAGNAVTHDTDGNIVIAGFSGSSVTNMSIVRHNSNGTLDTSFNMSGSVPGQALAGGASGGTFAVGEDVTLDASGKIIVTGYSTKTGGDFDMVLWRHNADGTVDTSFNSNGIFPGRAIHNSAAGGDSTDQSYDLTLDASGKLLVTGFSINAEGHTEMVIWRYLP